jgi:hypothetical protein
MPTRIVILALAHVLMAVVGVFLCAAMMLGLLGVGVMTIGVDLALLHFGALWLFVFALVVLFAWIQFSVGAAMMRGRYFGYVGGLVLAILELLSGLSSWRIALFGLFGLWALLTSREHFRG